MNLHFVILVEGADDVEVLRHLCRKHDLQFRGQKEEEGAWLGLIKNKEGYSNLIDSIETELKASDLEALAIVVDADVDFTQRWQSLRDKIRGIGYDDCPDAPSPRGTILTKPGAPLLGLWLMPDNTRPGILEDFVGLLIPKNDGLWPKAQQCVAAIPVDERPFKDVFLPKAQIHTWLAWREEPGVRMGAAINQRQLDSQTPAALGLIQWIRALLTKPPIEPSLTSSASERRKTDAIVTKYTLSRPPGARSYPARAPPAFFSSLVGDSARSARIKSCGRDAPQSNGKSSAAASRPRTPRTAPPNNPAPAINSRSGLLIGEIVIRIRTTHRTCRRGGSVIRNPPYSARPMPGPTR